MVRIVYFVWISGVCVPIYKNSTTQEGREIFKILNGRPDAIVVKSHIKGKCVFFMW